MQIVVWWAMPCKAISGVVRELAEHDEHSVQFVAVRPLGRGRLRLGWETPDFGKAELTILSETGWEAEAERLMADTSSALHVFNTLYSDLRVRYAAQLAAKTGAAFAAMTESRFNAFTGYRYWLKELYWRTELPRRTRPLARHSEFALCMSGGAPRALTDLSRLGWPRERVFPFAYFSEPLPGGPGPEAGREGPVRLLCTGRIEPNKGLHLLLPALAKVRDEGLSFVCDITGFGSQEARLKTLCSSLGLDRYVNFTGVLPTARLDDLKRAADLFVAPGLCEPWGIRINEAIQAELPVIISDGIGGSELVRASGGGRVFRSGSVPDMARVLGELISSPQERRTCRERLHAYRDRIHPRVAADYFLKVVECVRTPGSPAPPVPWLEPISAGTAAGM